MNFHGYLWTNDIEELVEIIPDINSDQHSEELDSSRSEYSEQDNIEAIKNCASKKLIIHNNN